MQRVEYELGFSWFLAIFLSLVHLIAVLAMFCLPIFIIFKMAGITLLFFYYVNLMNLHVKRSAKKSVITIWQDTAGRWGCLTKAKKAAIGELKGDSFKSALFLILRFRIKSGVRQVIIPVDALNPSEYRNLCARLGI